MIDEAKYTAVYGILIGGLIVELLVAIYRAEFGPLATAGILVVACLQAIFIFLVYMHGRYAASAVALFALMSILTVLPLFIALLLSVSMPHHGFLP